jgi:internalin A
MVNFHQVFKIWLGDTTTTLTTVAGTGTYSCTSNTLWNPYGIFVDTNFDLYVADSACNRIQLFQLGQLTATTIVGSTSVTTTITLNGPTGIVLDADKYLFIVDQYNHRIVGSGPTGFRCLVGCYGGGSASNQLYYPWSLSFDSYGSMFVADQSNSRIQKFILSTNSCSKYENIIVKYIIYGNSSDNIINTSQIKNY